MTKNLKKLTLKIWHKIWLNRNSWKRCRELNDQLTYTRPDQKREEVPKLKLKRQSHLGLKQKTGEVKILRLKIRD